VIAGDSPEHTGYDHAGNTVSANSGGTITTYTYDFRNRLTEVTASGTIIATYVYDALDRRIGIDDNSTQTWTAYDGTNPYADFNSSATLKQRYLYGPGVVNGTVVDELLARTSSVGTTAWYLPDKLGSVRDIVSTSGSALDHIVYDSFGNVVTESIPSNGDRFKFTGMEYDSATGQYYDQARYYHSATGTFSSQDPSEFNGGDANLYGYVWNNPTNLTDPTGLSGEGGNQASNAKKESMTESTNRVLQEVQQQAGQCTADEAVAVQQVDQMQNSLQNKEKQLRGAIWWEEFVMYGISVDEKNGFDVNQARQAQLNLLSNLHLELYGVMLAQARMISMLQLLSRSSQNVRMRLIGQTIQRRVDEEIAYLQAKFAGSQESMGKIAASQATADATFKAKQAANAKAQAAAAASLLQQAQITIMSQPVNPPGLPSPPFPFPPSPIPPIPSRPGPGPPGPGPGRPR